MPDETITKSTTVFPVPKPAPRKRNPYREVARNQERNLAKRLGGKRIPLSGGGTIKGDVLSKHVLAECKTSHTLNAKGEKVMTLQKEWLVKAEEEARAEGKPFAVTEIRFKGDHRSWMLIDSEVLIALLNEVSACREQAR